MSSVSYGKYFPEVAAGRVFIGSTAAAGTAFPISTGTAVTFGVWNNSPGTWVVPLWFGAGYTSGTIALGSLGFANQDVGFQVATGSPMTAFNSGTAKNALLGDGRASKVSFCPAGTTTLASGGTGVMVTGHSIESASAGTGVYSWDHDFDGKVIVRPGQIFFACSSVAQTALFTMSLAWAEIDAQ